jgi:WD40 repeat protein
VNDILCSGSSDHSIRTWNIEQTVCDRVLLGHEGLVSCLRTLKNKNLLISGSHDHQIRVWDIRQQKSCVYHVPNAHLSQINDIDCINEDEKFVTVSSDQSIKTWDIRKLNTPKEDYTMFNNSSIFSNFTFQTFSSSSNENTVSSSSGTQNEPTAHNQADVSYTASYGDVNAVKYSGIDSNNRSVVFIGCARGLLSIDLNTGETIQQFPGHFSDILACDIVTNQNILISSSKDRTVRMYDYSTDPATSVHTFDSIHSNDVTCLQVYNNELLYTGSKDGTVHEIDIASKQIKKTFERWVLQIFAFQRYNNILYCGCDEEVIRAWDVTATN